MKIFIIEDEPAIREELVQLLQKYGYQCDSSDDFHHIVQAALSSGANLILLDINLPYQDGFQVCREIRQKSNLPIIVLTSRNSDFDELMSLNIGADVLLVQYKPDADSNEVLQKMIPIGLDSTHGYRYAEKNMMYETFYGLDALVSFLCCYIGLVFLLICAALLALKQLTETTDNVYRYGLLQKLGAGRRQIDHTLFVQTAVFFAIPLVVAGVYSAFLIGKAMAVVEEFMNIHIATNIGLTIVLFLLVYGSYFLATYLSCKRIVTEQRELEV